MLQFPTRFTVCTYNIWTNTRWPDRRAALQSFARTQLPDILCLQELQAESKKTLDEALPTHQRVEDAFEGWTREGNIYWNTDLFELIECGAEQIGILEQYRRLFWVRLRVKDGSDRTIFVSTAHFTWHGHAEVLISEKNVRIPQARATVDALNRFARQSEAQLFMGDLNDTTEPIRILYEGGLTDCFKALGRQARHTWPALPTSHGPQQTIDWMLHRGAVRPLTAEVVDYYDGDMAPSDHKPIIATYELL